MGSRELQRTRLCFTCNTLHGSELFYGVNTTRQCLTAPEQRRAFFPTYLRPVHVLFPPHGFISLSDEPFSLAKVGQTVSTPRTVPIQGQIFRQPSANS